MTSLPPRLVDRDSVMISVDRKPDIDNLPTHQMLSTTEYIDTPYVQSPID